MKVSSRGMRRAGLTIALLLAGIACVALVLARYFYVPPNVIDVDLGGPYRLYAPDYEDQLVILYDRGDGLLVGRIGDVVVDVGWNDAYVVATRRPPDQPGGELSYYYIDIAKGSSKRRRRPWVYRSSRCTIRSCAEPLNRPGFSGDSVV
jgi:hypothetical protein